MHTFVHVENLLSAAAAGPLEPDTLARIGRLVDECYPAWA
jgi:hypothetical protein